MSADAGAAPLVSVLMPTFEQAAFIGRALASLQGQTLERWELIVVDDGSQDGTAQALAPWLADRRIRCQRLAHNAGLGRALNRALDTAAAPLIAYLPSDDLFHAEHLALLVAALERTPDAVLAYAGLRHHGNRHAEGRIPGSWLQLVQCMHRRADLRWIERSELESDDLDRLFWTRLQALGACVGTGRVSCEWTDHPAQRHKLMQEPPGGINPFRQRYRVREPLRFHTATGNAIDEPGLYRALRERRPDPAAAPAADGLKILLVGELAYNAERVLALAEAGHRLYGLWTDTPYWYNTVGPLPFGQVEDLPRDDWRDALKHLRPDLIYGLLNWQAVPFAHAVLVATPGIPFVWHFKEGPFICMEKGSWPQLLELYRRADGQVYSSLEMRDWFDSVCPGLSTARPSLVLDADLPKREWFEAPRSTLLSARDGEVHTVVPGRPIGLHPHTVAELAEQGIHLHFYGDFTQGQWREWIAKAHGLAPRHLHLHANVAQDRWVDEFSRYDAGWLHCFTSRNQGEIRRADWDDLNLPARIATLAMAGVPMIQRDNGGAIVAAQSLVRTHDVGLFYREIDDLAAQLREPARMAQLREQVWRRRMQFCFDTHAPALLAFFRDVIARAGGARREAC